MRGILRKLFLWVSLLLLFVLISCIEPYEPEIKKFDDVLVVNGVLTNLPGPYKISLS